MSTIHTIDLEFLGRKNVIACYLIKQENEISLVETGPYSCFDSLKKGLKQYGVKLTDIKKLFLTHIHLDHSGAAWALGELGVNIYVHPRGYDHLIQPEKLIASATMIYQDNMERLWSTIKPIEATLVHQVEDREAIRIGDFDMVAHHTPGHASHHIAWELQRGNGKSVLFAGDVAGIKINEGPVEVPLPPPDINLAAWKESIKRLQSCNPQEIYLAHFGKISNVAVSNHFHLVEESLEANRNWFIDYLKKHADKPNVQGSIEKDYEEYVKEKLCSQNLSDDVVEKYLSINAPFMTVLGMIRYLKKFENMGY